MSYIEFAQPSKAQTNATEPFTKAQIIGMIKEQEAGMPTAEVCRTHGLTQHRSTSSKPNTVA
jgi:hypothetical protein